MKESKKIPKRKLLGYLGRCGIRRETAESYLRDLRDIDVIKEENGEIIWIGPE